MHQIAAVAQLRSFNDDDVHDSGYRRAPQSELKSRAGPLELSDPASKEPEELDLCGYAITGDVDHVLARHNLDALTLDLNAVGGAGLGSCCAEGELVCVKGQPAFPAGELHAAG